MKLPVFKAVGASYALTFGHFIDCMKAVLLPLVLVSGISYWIQPKLEAINEQMAALKSDPQASLALLGPMFQWLGLLLLACFIFYPIMYAGILKWVVRGEQRKGIYIGFGADELRLIGTWLLTGLYLVILCIALIAVMVFGAIMGAAMHQPAVMIGVAVVSFIVAVIFIWVSIRLSLATPASIAQRRIGVGVSWEATKGNSWQLFFFGLFTSLPFVIVYCVGLYALFPEFGEYFQASMNAIMTKHPELIEAAEKTFNAAMREKNDLLMGVSFVFNIVYIPFAIVASGVAYRLITEGESESAE